MIGVIATISVKKGKEIEFQEMMKKLVNAVNLDEADNLFYRLYKKSPFIYVVLEGYKIEKLYNIILKPIITKSMVRQWLSS